MFSKPKFKVEGKRKLNGFIEKIAKNAAIDYSNQEIQDIEGAVIKVLGSIKDKMNERGLFKISRIEPSGSMAEHTSIGNWHGSSQINKGVFVNLEFDFLAVFELPSNCDISKGCQGCMTMKNMPWNTDILTAEGIEFHNDTIEFDKHFMREISLCYADSCSCLYFHETDLDTYKIDRNHSAQVDPKCCNCIIKMPTGYLQVETGGVFKNALNCSLEFKWISNDLKMLAFDSKTLQRSCLIKHLPVCIDFVPAVEILRDSDDTEPKHKCFIVPKACYNCDRGGWRISNCLLEIEFIRTKMSKKHRRCYLALKFLFQYFSPLLWNVNNYHMKTAVLHHSAKCSDRSKEYASCIAAILTDLAHAYDCGILPAFGRDANITGSIELDHKLHKFLAALLNFKSWEKFKNIKLNSSLFDEEDFVVENTY